MKLPELGTWAALSVELRFAGQRLTRNRDTSLRPDLLTPLEDESDSALGGRLPAEMGGRADLERVTTRRDVERVGTLGRSNRGEDGENEVEERTHVDS